MRLNDKINESVFVDDELTSYGFISHMKAYINDLLKSPITAKPDKYLQQYGIDGPKALKILLDKNKPYGPMLNRVEKIKTDDNKKDLFTIKYTCHNNDNNFYEKMKKLYNKYVDNGKLIKEEGEGGAMTGGATAGSESTGSYEAPLTKTLIKRKIYVTEAQLNYIKEAVQMDTMHGDFGYDAPGLEIKKNDPAMNHSNMIKKSRKDNKLTENNLRDLIRTAILESLKHQASEDRYVEWNIFDVIDDNQFNILVDKGIIPEELGGEFNIGIRILYDTYDATSDVPGSADEINRELCGDYDEAVKYINMITDPNLKKDVMESLNGVLYSDNYKEDSFYYSDEDDFYQDKYDRDRDARF